jgi:hypothetical protein
MGSIRSVWLLALLALAAVPAASARPARATFVGDSVADEIGYIASARALLPGVRLELAACRRLVQPSCSVAGIAPPSALSLVEALGASLGRTVVVSVGYNDPALLYAHDLDTTVRALERAHVQRILWLTLRATRHPYLTMNDAIRAAAKRHPDVQVVDWNRYSRSHPTWFRSDGLHLTPAGAIAMARLVHRALAAPG